MAWNLCCVLALSAVLVQAGGEPGRIQSKASGPPSLEKGLALSQDPWVLAASQAVTLAEGRTGGTFGGKPRAQAGLTRAEAVRQALANNPGLMAAVRQVEAARARRLQADGFEPPTLFWEWEEAKDLNPSRFGNQIYGIEQSIEWFGVRRARKQAADLGIGVAHTLLERARLRVTARTQKAFDRVLLTKAVARLLNEMLTLTTEAVDISRVRFKAGAGEFVDLMRTRIRREQIQNALREARVAVAEARRELIVLLGFEGEALTVRGELADPPLLPDAGDWLTRAQQGPTFVLLRRRIEQAAKALEAVRKGRFPELTVGIGRERLFDGAGGEDAWAGMLGLKFPLPGSDRQRGLEAEAMAEARTLEERGRRQRLEALARLNQRLEEARALDAQFRNYRDVILPDAEDQLKAAQQAYRVRRMDAFNLLDVYSTYLDTRRAYLETLARYRGALTDLETLGEDLWEVEL